MLIDDILGRDKNTKMPIVEVEENRTGSEGADIGVRHVYLKDAVPFKIESSVVRDILYQRDEKHKKKNGIREITFSKLIRKEELEYIKLPYNPIFFDFGLNTGCMVTQKELDGVGRTFYFHDFSSRSMDILKRADNLTGGPFTVNEKSITLTSVASVMEDNKARVLMVNGLSVYDESFSQIMRADLIQYTFTMINVIMKLLPIINCSNIVKKKNTIPSKLQKARKKRGKLPLRSYRTIEIKIPRSKIRGTEDTRKTSELTSCRLHTIMGHMKVYTDEKPLFGKFVGAWWWASQARGCDGEGVIKKDYKITNGQQ